MECSSQMYFNLYWALHQRIYERPSMVESIKISGSG
jgi:hypothetical protein